MIKLLIPAILLFITGCTGIPDNIKPVENFDINRYTGKWYEIARLDHSFERNLSKVTAEYSIRNDNGINVINRGLSTENNQWKEATGKAYFVGDPYTAHLKVSFFRPFYASYIIFKLDHTSYRYALVCSSKKKYLWILARTPAIEKELLDYLVAEASRAGFETDKLIFVDHQ